MATEPFQMSQMAKDQPEEFVADVARKSAADLLETLRDGQFGFEEAADKLDSPVLRNEFRGFAAQRARMAEQLLEAAGRFGVTDEGGTAAGALHRGWMALKDAVTAGDHAIVEAAVTGEDHAVSEYEEALEENLPSDLDAVVRAQYVEIKRTRDLVASLADQLD